jgi:iron complex outermembrane receptor protein
MQYPTCSHVTQTALLALATALASMASPTCAVAASATETTDAPPSNTDNGIAEGSDILVTATKANEIAPVTASLQQTQPASIVSRSFIEDSMPASADFNDIALISPSVSNSGGTNGVGLNESKTQIRGFQDGEYNITYDGVPFGDTNDPTHHSNTFFPSNTIETLVVDRGPGNASQLGQATFGGNLNLYSRETRADPSAEFKGTYGSFNTYLLRGLVQSGAVDKLNGSEFVLSGQYIKTDGRLTYSGYNQKNIFGKAVIPIGSSVKLTLLSTYNKNHFNQPDKDGSTLQEVTAFGKNYSLNNDPTSLSYYKYNVTTKTTDFEIAKLDAEIAPNATFTNTAYTYYYDNETLSGANATTMPTGVVNPTGIVLADGKTKAPGVPGYTKTNKYRVWGDIPKVKIDFGFGTLTAGIWLEHSDTFRQQTDVNLLTGGFSYSEKAVKNPVTGAQTPQYVKFNQNSEGNHTEEFVEFELRPIEGLKITPGFKHVDFERKVDALYNQTTRYAEAFSHDYQKNLPFATINYQIDDKASVYGQFAKGFLAPSLTVLYVASPNNSVVKPQTSTNYQAGAVYHGSRLSLDADVYYIDFNNKFQSRTITLPDNSTDTEWFNEGGVIYKGVEGQATYVVGHGFAVFANGSLNYAKEKTTHIQVANAPKGTAAAGLLYKVNGIRLSLIDKWTGPQYAIDESFVSATGVNTLNRQVKIAAYNTAIVAASYDWRNIRVGVEVTDLFNSTKLTNLGLSGAGPTPTTLNNNADQLYFQPGRQITGDVTVRF